jgi:hypothetical protein
MEGMRERSQLLVRSHSETSHPTVEDDERTAIDVEIAETFMRLLALKRRRNELSLIYRKLLPEILVLVFAECLPLWNTWETPESTWLAFSQVSHLWRMVALAHSPLWTMVDTRNRDIACMVRLRILCVSC